MDLLRVFLKERSGHTRMPTTVSAQGPDKFVGPSTVRADRGDEDVAVDDDASHVLQRRSVEGGRRSRVEALRAEEAEGVSRYFYHFADPTTLPPAVRPSSPERPRECAAVTPPTLPERTTLKGPGGEGS